ncbi:MAG: dihydroorotase [Rhodospirillaceae bacterium]
MTDTITIIKPDDWHLHLRDGDVLETVLPFTISQFARAIVMPNLLPPVVSSRDAAAYRERILRAIPPGKKFSPLMTAYLTDNTDPDDLFQGWKQKIISAVKMYPANATTNSAYGVTDWRRTVKVLALMEKEQIPLLIHGEVTNPDIDIFDRERVFIDTILVAIINDFPGLKVVLEHVTTSEGVDFVAESSAKVAATITPHHLVINRNDIFRGGIRPHLYCLPIAKREVHRLALRAAAVSGNPSFFLGTDSAPHAVASKETACGCAGIFNAPGALEIYTQVFEEENALHRLEAFASCNGPNFYNLPVNKEKIVIKKTQSKSPGPVVVGSSGEEILPFLSGETLVWKVISGGGL